MAKEVDGEVCFGLSVVGFGDAAEGVTILSSKSFLRDASLSMPFFLRKTLIVVRRALFGLQSSPFTGSCKQTGHA